MPSNYTGRKKTSLKNVAWLTSLPSPYWMPIWNHLAEDYNLNLFFTNSDNNERLWKVQENPVWSYHIFSKWIFHFGEAQIIPSPWGFRRICKKADILVIGGGWEVPIHVVTMIYARLRMIDVYIIAESVLESHRFNGILVGKIRFLVFSLATKVISVGAKSTTAVRATGIKEEKIMQLFNPVDVNFFNVANQKKSRVPLQGHRFLAVGRLLERKNFASIVKSFHKIAKPSDVLTIAGDGPLRGTLESLVAELKLGKQVIFTGYLNQNEIAELYSENCTLVLASTNEVWGMVATEALASGCHVVVSEKCGVSDFIGSMDGTYISGTDEESISKCMEKSRLEYDGPIRHPQILKFTPKKFTTELIKIFNKANV
jgi:glycosyltransferase involved in cell wall biosynthesis